jgi:hypothetical protein
MKITLHLIQLNLFLGDVDSVIEWQIWEGVTAENSIGDYMILINRQAVFEVQHLPI